MRKYIHLFIFLLLLSLIPFLAKAEYKPSIVCPSDGKGYVVVVKTSNTETNGPENFDPLDGSEHCVVGTMGGTVSGTDLVGSKVYDALDLSGNVQAEIVECTPAIYGGTDDYDWDNFYDSKALKDKQFSLVTTASGVKCGYAADSEVKNNRRIRYSHKGSYLYVIGAYKAPSGPADPDKLKAHCGQISSKDACNKDTNCEWGGSNFCYPKGALPTAPVAPTLPSAASIDEYLEDKYPAPSGGSNFLPDCAYPGTCDDITDLLVLLINVAKFLFKIIGTAAFAFFVYGGFTMVLSMGSADKVKSGRETLIAAVIGLVIAFSAYVLVDVVLDILQVSDDYRNVGSIK